MSKATPDVHTYDSSGPWFKIAQLGPTSSSSAINRPTQMSLYTFKIPASTLPGQHLLRIEHIALHSAKTAGGALSPTVSLPGGHSSSDPGILFNVSGEGW